MIGSQESISEKLNKTHKKTQMKEVDYNKKHKRKDK
jgi:hypothetical protein